MKVTTDACLFGAWVAEALKCDSNGKNVLDIGAGTGLLSLMVAQKNPDAHIDAVEIDREAYEQAKENVAISPFAEKVSVINDDARIFSFPGKYDFILANPPFYENEIVSGNQKKNIAHHHSGLLLHELLAIIKKNISPEGRFYLLLPFKRNEEIKKLLLREKLVVSKLVFVRQSTKHDYFRIMMAGTSDTTSEAETDIEEISIWDDHQQYTEEFKELLNGYYLNLISRPPRQ